MQLSNIAILPIFNIVPIVLPLTCISASTSTILADRQVPSWPTDKERTTVLRFWKRKKTGMPRRPQTIAAGATSGAMNGNGTNGSPQNGTTNKPRNTQSLDNTSDHTSKRSAPSTYFAIVLVVILLLAGQFAFFQKCQPDSLWESVAMTVKGANADGPFSSSSSTTTASSSGIRGGSFMKGQHFDVCIAGAGLSGAVLAERYASQLGATVLVVEKRDHIGGNCYDYLDVRTQMKEKYTGAPWYALFCLY